MPSKSPTSITLQIKPRGKPIKGLPKEIVLNQTDSGAQLYQKISTQSHFSIHRLRITKETDGSLIPNAKDVIVSDIEFRTQDVLNVKDLGPQIAWRTVFVIEYIGPILIHLLVYGLRQYLYTNPSTFRAFPPVSDLQKLSLWMIVLHFLKREFETMFVHRFSLATMPMFNIFKNSAHYWILAGANIAYWTYAPTSPTAKASNPLITYIAIAVYTIGELGNFSVHLTLRGLRSQGGAERNIPKSALFSLVPVTCPNYFFEVLAWIGIWMTNWSLSTGIFVAIAAAQMAVWAQKKERRYRKEFGDKYKKRRFAMLPGII